MSKPAPLVHHRQFCKCSLKRPGRIEQTTIEWTEVTCPECLGAPKEVKMKNTFDKTIHKDKKAKASQDKAAGIYIRALLTAGKDLVRPGREDWAEFKKLLKKIESVTP